MINNLGNITIVIVTYNGENIIKKCLNNLGKKYKIIIIENSSNYKLKREIEKKYKNVDFFVNKSNFGVSKSWNIGIKKSKTKYVLIMNPDSFPKKNCIKELIVTANKKRTEVSLGYLIFNSVI